MINSFKYNFLALTLFLWVPFSYGDMTQNRPFTLNIETITQGSLVIGRLKSDQLKLPHQILLNGNHLPITSDGHFVFGVGRDEVREIVLTTELTNKRGEISIKSFVFNIAPRNWEIERIDGLPSSTVNPRSAKLIKRIKKETKLVKQARASKSHRRDFIDSFISPAQGRTSGVFGSRRILNGVKKRPHFGLDIANRIGTPVIAPLNGIITLAETDLFFSGGTIIIDHGYGVSTTYLHLSQIDVKVGQIVSQTEKIGEIGATGRATGPHLDWRLNWNTTRLDPALNIQDRKLKSKL